MTRGRSFLSGHCNRANPPEIHASCRGGYQGLTCSCSCHHADQLRTVLMDHDVAGLAAKVEAALTVPGVWPPAARRLIVAARELLDEVAGRG